MSKKVCILLLCLVCIGGGALSVFLYTKTDREGPKIQFAKSGIVYHENEDTSVLLDGVTAVDDVDGDVTASLIVEAVYPSTDGTKAKIVYAAVDSSNNVTKKQKIVDYVAAQEDAVETGTSDVPVSGGSDSGETGTAGMNGNDSGETGTAGMNGNDSVAEITPTVQPSAEAESGTEQNNEHPDAVIAIINGSGVAGVAGSWQEYLENAGYTAIRTGSYKAMPDKTIIYTRDSELAEELLQYFPNASVEKDMPVDDVDIALDSVEACVVVGPQYAEVPEM